MSEHCSLEGSKLSVQGKVYDLDAYEKVYLFGSGKAAVTMAVELEALLGKRIYDGLIIAPVTDKRLRFIEMYEGSHPVPTQKSVDAARAMVAKIQQCSKDDLFIYLLSGGSSALMELPIDSLSLEDLQETTQLMLHHGLNIQQINTVRKHLSAIKGGRLAQMCDAEGVVLVISDLIDDDLYAIGSAPLYADNSSYGEAKELLQQYAIFDRLPDAVQSVLNRGCDGLIDETPQVVKSNVTHYIIASNRLALQRADQAARNMGLTSSIMKEPMHGSVESVIMQMLEELRISSSQCLIFGGECTVMVTGNGQGGRNQHAALLMQQQICKEQLDICFLSAGTDGIDGNSPAAGAVVDLEACARLSEVSLQEAIANCDSYGFFKAKEQLIETGPTGTNVIDIAILIKGENYG